TTNDQTRLRHRAEEFSQSMISPPDSSIAATAPFMRVRLERGDSVRAQTEGQRVDERLEGRLDHVRADTHGDPRALAVGRLDQDARDGVGAVALVEDADAEVDQVELGDVRVDLLDGQAQRVVEGVDGAVALADDGSAATAGDDLDDRLGAVALRATPVALARAGDDAPGLDLEVRRARAGDGLGEQQLEGGVRGL